MAATGNLLLDALSAREFRRLEAHLRPFAMKSGLELHDRGSGDGFVYFPSNSVTSLVITEPGGGTVEVATVGHEGIVGLPIFVDSETVAIGAFTHVPGEALRLPRSVLRRELRRDSELCSLIHRYTEALLLFVSQTCLCNSLHTQRQRLARWLLLIHDRVGGDTFDLTQTFMAEMLGVRRATVTITAGEFREKGLISYRKGRVEILNRRGLEAATCGCYEAVRSEFALLTGSVRPRPRRAD